MALRTGRVVRLSDIYTLQHTKFLPKSHGWVIFYQVFYFPGVVKMVGFCQITAWISGFHVVLRTGRVIRLSEMYTLQHTKCLPKSHGWVIFYRVVFFLGFVKMLGSVKKTACISSFQVVLRTGRVIRLSEMYTLQHTKCLPKSHGWVIFY